MNMKFPHSSKTVAANISPSRIKIDAKPAFSMDLVNEIIFLNLL